MGFPVELVHDPRVTPNPLVDGLNGRARRNARLLLGTPLVLLGAGLWLFHLRGSELVETTCRVAAAEELGFLAIHLEAEVAGTLQRSMVIASCRSAADRARGCGQPVGARVPCVSFRVEPGRLARERPSLPVVPILPALLLGIGALLWIGAVVAWLQTARAEGPSPPRWTRIPIRERGVAAIVLGGPLLLAGLGLAGLALHLLATSSSLANDFANFALLAGLGAALLGAWIGFSRSELRLDRERGVLQHCRGLFSPFLRRSYALSSFARAQVEEIRGKSSHPRFGTYRLHYLVLERAGAGAPLRIHFPDGERARRAAKELS